MSECRCHRRPAAGRPGRCGPQAAVGASTTDTCRSRECANRRDTIACTRHRTASAGHRGRFRPLAVSAALATSMPGTNRFPECARRRGTSACTRCLTARVGRHGRYCSVTSRPGTTSTPDIPFHPDRPSCMRRRREQVGRPGRCCLQTAARRDTCRFQECVYRRGTPACRRHRMASAGRRGTCRSATRHSNTTSTPDIPSRPDRPSCTPRPRGQVGRLCSFVARGGLAVGWRQKKPRRVARSVRRPRTPCRQGGALRQTCTRYPYSSAPLNGPDRFRYYDRLIARCVNTDAGYGALSSSIERMRALRSSSFRRSSAQKIKNAERDCCAGAVSIDCRRRRCEL